MPVTFQCPKPGCRNQLPCATHRKIPQADTKTDEERRFYSSWAWTQASKAQRRREPLCRTCAAAGRVTLAQMADHIIPLRLGGSRFDENNIQSMCNACHAVKRQSEGR